MNNDLTICIPTYKRLDYLHKLLGSIPNSIPVVISDNGSFIQNELDIYSNIRAIDHTDKILSMFDNWNNAVRLVKTNWFIIPGDDDLFLEGGLQYVLQIIQKYKDVESVGMFIFGHKIVNEYNLQTDGWVPNEETICFSPQGFNNFKYGVPARVPSIVFNTKKFYACGGFDTQFSFTAGDSFLIQKMALNYSYVLIPQEISAYRVWESNFTNTSIYTKAWFDQIKLWLDLLADQLIDKHKELGIDIHKIQNIILLNNELYALLLMGKKGISRHKRFKFIDEIGWPHQIGLLNYLKLIKSILC